MAGNAGRCPAEGWLPRASRTPSSRPFIPTAGWPSSRGADNTEIFDLESGRVLASLPAVASERFDAAGRLYTISGAGCFRWPVAKGGDRVVVGPPEHLPFPPSHQAFGVSDDGQVIAVPIFNGWGTQENAGAWLLHPDRPGQAVNVAPGINGHSGGVSRDGRWAWFHNHVEEIAVFDTQSGTRVWSSMKAAYSGAVFSGRTLAGDTVRRRPALRRRHLGTRSATGPGRPPGHFRRWPHGCDLPVRRRSQPRFLPGRTGACPTHGSRPGGSSGRVLAGRHEAGRQPQCRTSCVGPAENSDRLDAVGPRLGRAAVSTGRNPSRADSGDDFG